MKGPIYIAGPMSGQPQFGYPAFAAAAARLRAAGYEVISPAEQDTPNVQAAAVKSPDGMLVDGGVAGESIGSLVGRGVATVIDRADGVYVLNGWSGSRGARLEVMAATWSDKPIYCGIDAAGDLVPLVAYD